MTKSPTFTLSEDYIERVAPTRRIPGDAAIEFPCSRRHAARHEQQAAGGRPVCSFATNQLQCWRHACCR